MKGRERYLYGMNYLKGNELTILFKLVNKKVMMLFFHHIFAAHVGGNGPAYKTAEEYYDEVLELKKVAIQLLSQFYHHLAFYSQFSNARVESYFERLVRSSSSCSQCQFSKIHLQLCIFIFCFSDGDSLSSSMMVLVS